eukprot:6237287-Pyramimonas_sp.AAC.1
MPSAGRPRFTRYYSAGSTWRGGCVRQVIHKLQRVEKGRAQPVKQIGLVGLCGNARGPAAKRAPSPR